MFIKAGDSETKGLGVVQQGWCSVLAPWKSYRKEVSPSGAAVSSLRSDNDRSEPRWGSSKLTKNSEARVLGNGFSGLAWE